MSEQKSNVKKRNWAIIIYPESLPNDWKSILQETGLPIAISPLHDKDLNVDGEPKKPHYHCILCYSGPTSYNVVKKLCDSLNSPIPQPLESIKGNYRYFTHKDNPEKYQYSENDICIFNGFNISDFVEMTKSEVITIKKSLQTLIRNLGLMEYSDFMDYLLDNDLNIEYEVASNNTYFFERYLSSTRNKYKENKN